MPAHQIPDVTALIATTDEQTARQAKGLFSHYHVMKSTREFEKEVRRFRQSDETPGLKQSKPHIVLFDLDMPSVEGSKFPEISWDEAVALILFSSLADSHLEAALHAGADDYLLKPFRTEDLTTRVRKILQQRTNQQHGSVDPPLRHLVEKLHDRKDGHLDARKVADFFAITVADLARLIDRGVSTVHKTPSAPGLQESLRKFESMASGLLRLTGSERRSRMWLQASNPALAGHAPIELLKMGKIDDLARFIQDLLEGRPA